MKSKSRSIIASLLIATIVMIGCTTDQIIAGINVGIDVAQQLVNIVGTATGADQTVVNLVNNTMTEASKDLKDLEGLYQQYKAASPTDKPGIAGEISKVGNLVQDNLATLLADAHVKSSPLVDDVTRAVAVINSSVALVLTLLPPGTFQAKHRAVTLPTVPGAKKAEDLKKYWNDTHPQHKV
jgi:hypothetical protein